MALTLEEIKAALETEERQLAVKRELAAEQRAEINRLKILIEQRKAAGDSVGDLENSLRDLTTAYKAATESINRDTEALRENQKAHEQNARVAAATQTQLESLTQGFLSLETSIGKMVKGISQGDFSLLKFAKSGLAPKLALGQLAAVGAKAVDMLVQFGLRQDEVIAQFKAQTGAGDEFNETIRDVALANIAAGVSLEDVAGAVRSLKNEFTDFTYLTQQQQEEITQTTVQLEKLGFSFGTQAKIIQTATQTLGMDVGEANDLLIDLASTARSLGVDIDVLGGQFAANKDFIVRFGEDGQEVFEEMAVAAKALGTELGTLVGVVDKFKTFDEAGRIVGRFNAILGGPFLNSIDMLNAAYEDPIEGIKMLRDGFDQAGKSIEDLGGAELEAFASALGLSTSETIELLGKSNEELEIQRMNQQEVAEAARQAQSAMEQLTNAFNQLIIDAKPFIDGFLVPAIGYLGDFAKFLGDASSAASAFMRVGLAVAGVAAIIAAPLTMGTSLPIGTALLASAGIGILGGGTAAALKASATSGGVAAATPRFEQGGTIMSEQAIVHPGEMLITGGQGSEVISKKDFKELIDAMKNQGQGPQQIAVYVGQEKIDNIVVKALDSTAGRNTFSPFTNG
jgi:DNA-binding transcriptional MerR regulator